MRTRTFRVLLIALCALSLLQREQLATLGETFRIPGDLAVGGTTDTTGETIARSGVRLSAPTTGPIIRSGTGSPNGVVSATAGSLWVRTDSPQLYQNTDGATAWSQVAGTAAFSGASVYNVGSQSVNNNTVTAITYNTEEYDTDNYHSTVSNTSRLTVPTTAKYLVSVTLYFDAATVGVREIDITKNVGATTLAVQAGGDQGGVPAIQNVTFTANLTAGDYIETNAFQTKGVAVNVIGASYAKFQITRVGS